MRNKHVKTKCHPPTRSHLGLSPLPAATSGSTGIIGDLSSAANQLGVGQAIDLLKGVVMPGITRTVNPWAAA